MKFYLSIVFQLLLSFGLYSQYPFEGTVTDAADGTPLAEALITTTGRTQLLATTDNSGRYYFEHADPSLEVVISYIGYRPETITLQSGTENKADIELSIIPMEAVEVTATRDLPLSVTHPDGRISMPIERLVKLPSFLGEPDVVKSLTFLPGIASGREGLAQVLVRGGNVDQNMFLLDGVPVFGADHIFGLVSGYNSEALQRVEFYKSGFPARYGGRLSSVLDVQIAEGNRKKWNKQVAVGLLSTGFRADGPLSKKSALLVAGRAALYSLVAIPLSQTTEGYTRPGFYDFNLQYTHELSENHTLKASGFWMRDYINNLDEFNFTRDESTVRIVNGFGTLRWTHRLSPKFHLHHQAAFSSYRSSAEYLSETVEPFTRKVISSSEERPEGFVRELLLKSRGNYYLSQNHALQFGLEISNKTVLPEKKEVIDFHAETNTTIVRAADGEEVSPLVASLFLQDEIQLNERWKARPGYRLTYYTLKGFNKFLHSPRLHVQYQLQQSHNLIASYAHMHQPLHQVANQLQGTFREIWISADAESPPASSHQWDIGWNGTVTTIPLSFSVGAYYKKMRDLVDLDVGEIATEEVNTVLEDIESGGEGEAYGAEFFVEKAVGDVQASASYTLSWSDRQYPGLNFGSPFPADFHRKHDLAITTTFPLNKRVVMNANWIYASGRPHTFALQKVFDPGFLSSRTFSTSFELLEGINNIRLPAYHRLDLSVSRVWLSPKGKEQYLSLNIYNAYARRNANYLVKNNNKIFKGSNFSVIPSLRYRIKF